MTLGELAALLKVSPASISIVRQGKPGVSPATRQRIQSALTKHGFSYVPYLPNQTAAPMKLQDAPIRYIRLLKYYQSALLTDKNEGFVDAIINAIDAIARASDYTLVYSSVSSAEYDRVLSEGSFANCLGLLVIGTEMGRDEIEKLKQVNIPVVVLDCDHADLPFSTVTMNNRDLAYNAVKQLKHLGEVGYLRSRIRTGNFVARSNGYREAVWDFGLPMNDDMIFTVTPSLNNACEDMRQYLNQGRKLPRAFFADNDVIAIGAMRAMRLHGYKIPQDISIIGVDNTMLAQISSPALSSIQISCTMLGEQAIHMLLSQIDHPTQETLHMHIGSQLILRESTQHT